jgi:aspartyl-tRNA(Asn)/glutamyl-tRNA(Gln) amidotransferase subunit A
MTSDLAIMTAGDLLQLFRRGDASPVEAVQAALARIDRHDDALKAFALVDREGALAAAKGSEARWRKGRPQGLLDGVPVTIKDLQLTRGWPTRRGSRTIDPKARGPTTHRPWRGCARMARFCSARRRRPSSAGRGSPTAR